MENKNSNNKVVVFLLIIIICLLIGGGFLTYKILINKPDADLGETNSNNQQLSGETNTNTQQPSNDSTYGLITYNNGIPQVNLSAAKDFNKKVKENYSLSKANTVSCGIRDNILYCAFEERYDTAMDGKASGTGFIYDLVSDKVMTIEGIFSKYNVNKLNLEMEDYVREMLKNNSYNELFYLKLSDWGRFEAVPTDSPGYTGFSFGVNYK